MKTSYLQKLQLWESNFGRFDGWEMLLDDEVIGILDDHRWEDMFWDSYRITPTDPVRRDLLLSEEFWSETAVPRSSSEIALPS